jgi:aminopeptidase-like protein
MAQTEYEHRLAGRTTGDEMMELIAELYPICRSITGEGVRQTLRVIQQQIPLRIEEVPSGTSVLDWTVPKEWNIKSAFIKSLRGETIVDFSDSNLHVVGYSVPFRGKVSLENLQEHLFTLEEYPDWIPYRTSYYKDNWGFCLSHRRFVAMTEEEYEVCVESSLTDGCLNYGECYLPGTTNDEVLISIHVCHPSLCNDNLSGIALGVALARYLTGVTHRYSYRFLFIPGTIGSITWLSRNEDRLATIKHGFVIAGVGDSGAFTYKKSRRGDAEIDRVFQYLLNDSAKHCRIIEFLPYGYDERQFCSPGFNLPIGCVMRTPHGQYPEYHTSADNLDFVSVDALIDSFDKCVSAVDILEKNKIYRNQSPKGEPQLGKRGLYTSIGGTGEGRTFELALLWTLNFSDGSHSLLEIAARSSLPFALIRKAADALLDCGLLKEC